MKEQLSKNSMAMFNPVHDDEDEEEGKQHKDLGISKMKKINRSQKPAKTVYMTPLLKTWQTGFH
jgi:hypothetical protein